MCSILLLYLRLEHKQEYCEYQILLDPGGPIIYQTAQNRILGSIIAVGLVEGISPSEDRCLDVRNVVMVIEREVVLAKWNVLLGQ